MDIRFTIITTFLLFLLFSSPPFSTGDVAGSETEVYDIDYRGPETHSSGLPPPGHSHGRTWFPRKANYKSPTKSKDLKNKIVEKQG